MKSQGTFDEIAGTLAMIRTACDYWHRGSICTKRPTALDVMLMTICFTSMYRSLKVLTDSVPWDRAQ